MLSRLDASLAGGTARARRRDQLGALALIVLALGLVGLLDGIVFAVGLIAALLLLRRAVIGWLRDGLDVLHGMDRRTPPVR